MFRRVIVDLMLALFATLFAVAVATHHNRGKQPLSQNYILVVATESLKYATKNAISFTSPSEKTVPLTVYPGFPEDLKTNAGPKIYIIFPAAPGNWTLGFNSDVKKIAISTRSGPIANLPLCCNTNETTTVKVER